ncbi:type II toxin-antitoxin system PemK/MazF family toxin [Pleurocapsa sp. PCC 7319]|uniref:type II toxin-antitoxin system PemK/MazF family toxin n=1 Tax=Pleurocapsa sp. PCC 7319 TaxID=118161 RepID=UPI000347BDBF|nr:type II toxin-antitoxin system PemK/MazF family toxin [Pleurocapsa sp. PCC 7319]
MPSGQLTYRRGDIYWVELDPTRGTEAKKTRACLIMQNDFGNKQSSLTIVVPFLAPKNYPFVVNVLPSNLNGLDQERGLHLSQIRAVDVSRIKTKVGEIEKTYWKDIKKAVDIQLGFNLS